MNDTTSLSITKTELPINSLIQNCRLLYHLTQIPVFLLCTSEDTRFSFPHIAGIHQLAQPLLSKMQPQMESCEMPVFRTDNPACCYAGYAFSGPGGDYKILFGPCLYSRLSRREFMQMFPELNTLSSREHFSLMSALPVITPEYLCDLLALSCSLFFRLEVHASDIWKANHLTGDNTISAAAQDTLFRRREAAEFHTPYSYEKKMLDAVRLGDFEHARESMNEINLTGKPGTLSSNPLRHGQNLFIAHITQITRAAIEGGVAEDKAYAMSDSFIQASEKCTTPAALTPLSNQAVYDFTAAVAKAKTSISRSPAIRRAINYINDHQQVKIYLSDIAKAAGLSTSRFSHLFKKETGITPMEYLCRERIETAKSMLSAYEYSVSEISMLLAFSNQSHFISAFKKHTGITPGQYLRQGTLPAAKKTPIPETAVTVP